MKMKMVERLTSLKEDGKIAGHDFKSFKNLQKLYQKNIDFQSDYNEFCKINYNFTANLVKSVIDELAKNKVPI